jgi:adenosylmethionine-8-amino-7-oxononanoate aminotransferase
LAGERHWSSWGQEVALFTGHALWNDDVTGRHLGPPSSGDFLVEAKGTRVRDAAGRWFLDARSGLWNVSLGYGHPRVVEAVESQLKRLPYAPTIRYRRPSDIAVAYADSLAAALPGDLRRLRFVNTGSQAVETAVLLSRFTHRAEGNPDRTAVFGLWNSYHGYGGTAGVVTGDPYGHYSCGPLMPGTHHAHDPQLTAAITDFGPNRVSAVVVEPILGNGGAVLSGDYLRELAGFCAANGIHLIFDEVTTGMGRVGALTRAEQVGVTPDLMALGKGITSGYVPLAAVAVQERIYQAVSATPANEPFPLGSTSDGSPLAMAAGQAVLDVLLEGETLADVAERGASLERRLHGLRDKHPTITAVRGHGLMFGVGLADPDGTPWPAQRFREFRLAVERRGVLVADVADGHSIMLMPPLVVTEEDLDEIEAALDGALAELAPIGGE